MSRRNKKRAKQRMMILLATVLLITVGSVIFGSSFSNAHGNTSEEPVDYKYYKSIVIQEGDTLWSIAKEYKTDAYESTQEYIDELMKINSLTSDVIHADQHLVVAYYDSELK